MFNVLSSVMDLVASRCPACGVAAQTICAKCWYLISVDQSPQLTCFVSEPFPQRALFRLDGPDDPDFVRRRRSKILRSAILASKGNPNRRLTRFWAQEIYRRAALEGLWRERRDWLVIAPPQGSGTIYGKVHGHRDHATELAAQVSECGDLSFAPGVFEHTREWWRPVRSQKSKTREDRSKIQFHISNRSRLATRERWLGSPGFLFMDDVISTGATAKAAWIALGKPAHFEAWAIVWRRRESPCAGASVSLNLEI